MRSISIALLSVAAAACGAADLPPVPPGCNPLVGADCLTPFPSSLFEAADPTTPTGVRLAIPPEAMPLESSGARVSPERANRADGFSPSTPILVWLGADHPIAAEALPGEADLARSLDDDATVRLWDMASGERVPLWAELDGNARPSDPKGLLIHPAIRLRPAARYAVALVDLGAQPPRFRARAADPRTAEVLAFVEAHGVPRTRVTLAWDFHTASDAAATTHLQRMRDLAFARLADLTYTIDASTDAPANDPVALRTVSATIDVPSFLLDKSGRAPLDLDADGLPRVRGLDHAPVTIIVPRCAATRGGPIPLVIFGPGLFLGARELLTTRAWRTVANDVCAVYAGTDWIGLSGNDVALAATAAASDLDLVGVITDRLQQAEVNALVMTRLLVTRLKDDAALAWAGRPIVDGSEVYYYGISNGGILGAGFLALSPDVQRGVLNVPGGLWSLMISRSTDFVSLKGLLGGLLPNPLEQQLVFAISQTEWDHTDGATFAPHLLAQPLGGQSAKRVLVQESIGDAQVPNVATRIVARAMGVPALGPLGQPVFGLPVAAAPLDSAYTQWDSGATLLPPPGNVALPEDNGAHNAIWPSPGATAQIRAFFRPDGQVTDVCGGAPCRP